MVTILEIVALVLEETKGIFIIQIYDKEMDLRQAGGIHRPIVSLAGVAGNSDTGEN